MSNQLVTEVTIYTTHN